MLRKLMIPLFSLLLLTACGGSSSGGGTSSSSAANSSVSSADSSESISSTPSSDGSESSSEGSPESSSEGSESSDSSEISDSSESSESSSPTVNLSFGFSEGIDGWYLNGGSPGVTLSSWMELEHDAINEALALKPLDWSADNWRYQARIDFDAPTDLSDASISFVVTIPEEYITDGGLSFQFIIHHPDDTNYGVPVSINDLPAANEEGDYVIGRSGITLAGATGIGFQLATPPGDEDIKDSVLVKSVLLESEDGSVSSSSDSSSSDGNTDSGVVVVADFEDDAPGTTYSGISWSVEDLIAEVVTIESITAGDGLPANGDSVNVLKITAGNYNAVPKFSVTLQEGKTLADYKVVVDAYFPRNTVGLDGVDNNYWKDFLLFAATELSGAGEIPNPGYQSQVGTGTNVDAWISFDLLVDAESELTGSIEIALGISRPGGDDVNDVYYLDNIRLVEID